MKKNNNMQSSYFPKAPNSRKSLFIRPFAMKRSIFYSIRRAAKACEITYQALYKRFVKQRVPYILVNDIVYIPDFFCLHDRARRNNEPLIGIKFCYKIDKAKVVYLWAGRVEDIAKQLAPFGTYELVTMQPFVFEKVDRVSEILIDDAEKIYLESFVEVEESTKIQVDICKLQTELAFYDLKVRLIRRPNSQTCQEFLITEDSWICFKKLWRESRQKALNFLYDPRKYKDSIAVEIINLVKGSQTLTT